MHPRTTSTNTIQEVVCELAPPLLGYLVDDVKLRPERGRAWLWCKSTSGRWFPAAVMDWNELDQRVNEYLATEDDQIKTYISNSLEAFRKGGRRK